MINFILGFFVGGGVVYFFMLMTQKPAEKAIYGSEDAAKKVENLKAIESFIADKEKFTNDDLEKLLGVSNTTVGRYLKELEDQSKITQHGDIGSGVYYTKNTK